MRSFHEAVGDLKFRNSVGSLKKTHVKRQRFVHSGLLLHKESFGVLKSAPMLNARWSQIWVNVCHLDLFQN